MPHKKTPLMRRVEARLGESLETALPRLLSGRSVPEAASEMGISTGCLYYWIARLGFQLETELKLMPQAGVTHE